VPVKRVASGLVVALAALALAATGVVRASFPGPSGDIVFAGFDPAVGGDAHLYAMHADGSGLRPIDGGDGNDESLSVAPGGTRILISRDTHEQCGHLYWAQGVDLFTVASDGGGLVRLTDNCPTSDSTPAWSPTGAHVVFSRFGELWSMRADGTSPAKLTCTSTGGDGGDYAPDWSPDGRLIAFDHFAEVELMSPDGRSLRALATGSGPSFSPDGARVAYAAPAFGDAPGIHVIGVDGSGDRRLTTGADSQPVWSPDGTRIAFVRTLPAPQRFVLEVMNADGGGLHAVVTSLNVTALDWASAPGTVSGEEPTVSPADTACAEAPASPPPAPLPPPRTAQAVPPAGIAAAAVRRPNGLVVAGVSFRPPSLCSRLPFHLTVAVRDRSGVPVVGAAVRVAAVRSDVRTTGVRRTRGDGSVTLTLLPTSRLRLVSGRRLVLIVRATRPGDSWNAPASAQRRVSVRTGTHCGTG
jgi:Tol biopolymer transport system component